MDGARVAFGFALVAMNFAYWWSFTRLWNRRLRRWIERRYNVQMARTGRGWEPTGEGPRLRQLKILGIELACLVAAFAVWGGALLAGLVVLGVR